MNYHYRLIETMEGTRYVLHDGDQPIGEPISQVAVCFDLENGVLHKHGKADMVETWYQKSRKKLIDAGAADMAKDLVVISGPIDIQELNKMMLTSGYCKLYMKRLDAEKMGS